MAVLVPEKGEKRKGLGMGEDKFVVVEIGGNLGQEAYCLHELGGKILC